MLPVQFCNDCLFFSSYTLLLYYSISCSSTEYLALEIILLTLEYHVTLHDND